MIDGLAETWCIHRQTCSSRANRSSPSFFRGGPGGAPPPGRVPPRSPLASTYELGVRGWRRRASPLSVIAPDTAVCGADRTDGQSSHIGVKRRRTDILLYRYILRSTTTIWLSVVRPSIHPSYSMYQVWCVCPSTGSMGSSSHHHHPSTAWIAGFGWRQDDSLRYLSTIL